MRHNTSFIGVVYSNAELPMQREKTSDLVSFLCSGQLLSGTVTVLHAAIGLRIVIVLHVHSNLLIFIY